MPNQVQYWRALKILTGSDDVSYLQETIKGFESQLAAAQKEVAALTLLSTRLEDEMGLLMRSLSDRHNISDRLNLSERQRSVNMDLSRAASHVTSLTKSIEYYRETLALAEKNARDRCQNEEAREIVFRVESFGVENFQSISQFSKNRGLSTGILLRQAIICKELLQVINQHSGQGLDSLGEEVEIKKKLSLLRSLLGKNGYGWDNQSLSSFLVRIFSLVPNLEAIYPKAYKFYEPLAEDLRDKKYDAMSAAPYGGRNT